MSMTAAPLLLPVYERQPAGPRADFRLASDYLPAGDQPTAIAELIGGVNGGERDQVLLGVTGSGKTLSQLLTRSEERQ